MPATDDEIREKYLERAIRELNTLTRELQACPHCPRGNLMPVLGSGHPQADVFLLKHAPMPPEIEEGVAFYGRAGTALMKSFKRLAIDPLAVYGTLCVKCPVADTSLADPACVARVVEELAIVQPKIVVVMGEDALESSTTSTSRWRDTVAPTPGESSSSPPRSTRCTCRTSTRRSTRRPPSARSGRRSGCSASGTPTCRRTERRSPPPRTRGGLPRARRPARRAGLLPRGAMAGFGPPWTHSSGALSCGSTNAPRLA